MNNLKLLWDKIKKIKHIEIYIAVFAALLILIIYLSSVGLGSSGKPVTSDNNNQNSTNEFASSAEYVTYLENKLTNVLSSIKGTSNVKVIITLENGFGYKYVTEEETLQTNEGTQTTSKLVLVNGKPVVEQEYYPSIKGVVVVAKGADDVTIKMNILSIIQTVIDVDNSQITILAGN